MEIKNLVTVKSYADKLGVSTTWIYKMIKAGKIRSIEIDGIRFISTKQQSDGNV